MKRNRTNLLYKLTTNSRSKWDFQQSKDKIGKKKNRKRNCIEKKVQIQNNKIDEV